MANIDDEDLLDIIKTEFDRSLGLDDQGVVTSEIQESRANALLYQKGQMPDVPAMENRSSFVSTDFADAKAQIIPQIMEVLMNEDLLEFEPINEADIQMAAQETEYVSHVIWSQNDGYRLMRDATDDALTLKTGIWVWYWDEGKPELRKFSNMAELDVQGLLAVDPDQLINLEQNPDGTYNYETIIPAAGQVKIDVFPPEDVAVSEDTTKFGNGAYCVFRSRRRRFELVEEGYDADDVALLPAYSGEATEIKMHRGSAGESQASLAGGSIKDEYEIVEVYHHYIRVSEGPTSKLMKVVTGDGHDVILAKEEVDCVDAAYITPFPIPHRFYGESLFDRVQESQRVNTVLTRMMLDSGYYAVNNRWEVPESHVSKHTLNDILNNVPGSPVRTKIPGGVQPIQTAGLGFDALQAIEFMKTQLEQRTGIMRGAGGMTPDTLHKTATGMTKQMTQGMDRVRQIVRDFIETGIKDLYVGVHRTLRENASSVSVFKHSGQFIPVNPSLWNFRDKVKVEVGKGREADMEVLSNVIGVQRELVGLQGGNPNGDLIKQENIIHASRRLAQMGGLRQVELYFPEPTPAQPQQPQDPMQTPQMMLAQAELQQKMQIEQMKVQSQERIEQYRINTQAQIEQGKLQLTQLDQAKFQIEQVKAQSEIEIAQRRVALEEQQILQQAESDRTKILADVQMKQEKTQIEAELKRQIAELQARLKLVELDKNDENVKLEIMSDNEIGREANILKANRFNPAMPRVELGGDEV